jgi:hypothetical protein
MSRSVATTAIFCLAIANVGCCAPPPPVLMAYSGCHSLGLSSDGGQVHHQDPLCLSVSLPRCC